MIEAGDYIMKETCSDTLYLIKGNDKFQFLVGDRLYNSLDRSQEFIKKWRYLRRIVTTNNDCE